MEYIILLIVLFVSACIVNFSKRVNGKLAMILENQLEEHRSNKDRISNLHDHIRTIEKGIVVLKDELSKHGCTIHTDTDTKAQIWTIQKEIREISSCLLKMVPATNETDTKIVKPKRGKNV